MQRSGGVWIGQGSVERLGECGEVRGVCRGQGSVERSGECGEVRGVWRG